MKYKLKRYEGYKVPAINENQIRLDNSINDIKNIIIIEAGEIPVNLSTNDISIKLLDGTCMTLFRCPDIFTIHYQNFIQNLVGLTVENAVSFYRKEYKDYYIFS